MRKQFELWLDESGDFEDEKKEGWNPSLVGGVLVEKGNITEESAREMIGRDYIHYTDEAGSENMKLLEKIKEANGRFVIFENKERVKIIDGDTTYLNVLAEGIIQLLLRLSAMYQDFTLNILIATRKRITEGYGIISEEAYENRLRERIIVGLARNLLTRKNNWDYKIEFGDARYLPRLMLADGVCNTYLTRTAPNKFTREQRERIVELYDEPFIFSFFEHSTRTEMERLLAEGNVSDVLFECYLPSNIEIKQHFLTLALDQLEQFDEFGQALQLQSISNKIEILIKLDRRHVYTEPILEAMQKDLLPKLAERNIHVPTFDLDIILYLYTLYTHDGSVKAAEQDDLFMEKLHDVKEIMTKFDYFNMYQLRRSIHEKNMLNIKGSIKNSSKAIHILDEMVNLMGLLDDGVELTDTLNKYETLGKAYGTRGQGYTMLIHEDEANLAKAIQDFRQALKHFQLNRDKERQYLYKSQAYTEAGKFVEATDWLLKASLIEKTESPYHHMLQTWKKESLAQTIFKYHTYFKIMGAAVSCNKLELADQLYDAIVQEEVHIDQLASQYKSAHPMQFILWNYATYLFAKGRDRQAHHYIDQAIDLCHRSGQTLQVIQLGMYAEKLMMAHEKGNAQQANHIKQSIKDSLHELRQASNAKQIFDYLEGITAEDLTEEAKLHTLITLTRCIN